MHSFAKFLCTITHYYTRLSWSSVIRDEENETSIRWARAASFCSITLSTVSIWLPHTSAPVMPLDQTKPWWRRRVQKNLTYIAIQSKLIWYKKEICRCQKCVRNIVEKNKKHISNCSVIDSMNKNIYFGSALLKGWELQQTFSPL